jgi:hypothetical protein
VDPSLDSAYLAPGDTSQDTWLTVFLTLTE